MTNISQLTEEVIKQAKENFILTIREWKQCVLCGHDHLDGAEEPEVLWEFIEQAIRTTAEALLNEVREQDQPIGRLNYDQANIENIGYNERNQRLELKIKELLK